MWYIEASMCIFNNKLKKISFKTNSYEKVKKKKSDSWFYYKVIPLAHLNIFAL
jgi:hypothetical protein